MYVEEEDNPIPLLLSKDLFFGETMGVIKSITKSIGTRKKDILTSSKAKTRANLGYNTLTCNCYHSFASNNMYIVGCVNNFS